MKAPHPRKNFQSSPAPFGAWSLVLGACALAFSPSALLAQASFRADDPTLPPGTPVTFRWDASVAYLPVLNPGNLSVSGGELRLIPPEGRTTFQLSYLQGKTPRVETVIVETGLPPIITSIAAFPPVAAAGSPVTFTFAATGADSFTVWKRDVGRTDWLPVPLGPLTTNTFRLALATDTSVRIEAANAFGLSRAKTDVGVVFPAGSLPPASPVNAPVSPGLPSVLSGPAFRSQLVPVEIMAAPATRTDAEKAAGFSRQDFGWMELRNLGFRTVSLANYQLRGGVSAELNLLAAGVTLSPGQSVILANSRAAYVFRHGTPAVPLFGLGKPIGSPADSFQLVWSQDFATDAKLAHDVRFDASRDGLDLASGGGHSLVTRSLSGFTGVFTPADWTTGTRFGGTPGAPDPAGSGELLLITEVFAAGSSGRAVELLNSSAIYVAGPGLWQSDGHWGNSLPLTVNGALAPGRTNAFWKDTAPGNAPIETELLLDPLGGAFAVARSFPGGFPQSLVAFADYGPMAPGQARVRTVTSTGQVYYRLAEGRTPGLAEPPPPPPAVVFSRLHFAPTEDSAEFVEITNRSAAPRTLSENGKVLKIKGFDFGFPAGTTLAPGETVTVSALPEATLRAKVALPAGRRVFTGSGKLDNSGERLALEAGGIEVSWGESLTYGSTAPWPTQAVSLGWSLVRLNPETSADDPANWTASPVVSP